MFPGLCEVVLHDLRDPQHAIRAIENNLSGRQVGDSATELGLARVADPHYPSVIQNYPNQFPDGRPAKSTSIGIKNASGEYIAALCLNLDVSVLSPVTLTLSNLVATDTEQRGQPIETLRDRNARELRRAVEAVSAERGGTPRSLSREAKKALVRRLYRDGYFDSRDAQSIINQPFAVFIEGFTALHVLTRHGHPCNLTFAVQSRKRSAQEPHLGERAGEVYVLRNSRRIGPAFHQCP